MHTRLMSSKDFALLRRIIHDMSVCLYLVTYLLTFVFISIIFLFYYSKSLDIMTKRSPHQGLKYNGRVEQVIYIFHF
jgi:hypothetical protein